MLRPQSLLAAGLGLVLSGAAAASTSPVPTNLAPPSIDVPLMREVVARLASDEFEGRGPSTAVEPKVLDEIVARFKAAGLQPGNHGSWLQEVPTVEIAGRNHSPLTVNGGTAPLSFQYNTDWVAASYRAVPRTAIAGSELVFVGYGIVAPELGWNDYAGVDMHGKTAVILVNDPDYAMSDENGPFKGRRMTYYGRWTYKFEEAARQGATAALIVHDTFPAGYGWNVVNSSWSGAQYYVRSANNGMDQTQANGWVQKPVAEAIFKAAGKDLPSLTAAAQTRGFRPIPLGLTVDLSFDNALRNSTSHNVIGIQPGRTRPDEYVLYSAHWDHLGHCPPDARGDGICNGAVDNATGVAALVALAKANAAAGPPARSQIFAAWTLEESGLLGSEFYARNPVYPLSRTAGGVNMDAILPTGRFRDVSMTGGDKSQLSDDLDATLKDMGLVRHPESGAEKGGYYRSDHFSLAKRGVPMFALKGARDLVDGGVAAGSALGEDYTAHRYHQPSDEYSPDWDFSGIAEWVDLYYRLGRGLATSAAWPDWRAGDEFRKVRDASCADRKEC